jgi:hypothetical protein
MKPSVGRTVAILAGVGLLNACSPVWIPGGFKLDTVELPILQTLAGREQPLFSPSHANTPPLISIITPSLEIDPGATVFLGPNDPIKSLYAVSDAEGSVSTLSIVSSVDGPLPPEEFIFPSLGPRLLTITATDTQGASTHATLTVNVMPTSPDRIRLAQGCAQIRVMACS